MQKITSIADLRNAIELLKVEHNDKEQLLKEQFYLVFDSFSPFNYLEQKIKEMTSPTYLIDNIIGAVIGLAAGNLSKMLVIGKSSNLFRKFSGSLLQFGVTKFIAQHAGAIKLVGQLVIQHILSKKDTNSERL